ncbi:MAG: hypothetical protein KDL87_19875, partial [Verrucomicrobiae bacterium]|nr:hypothetical protein [Verrucomicrobiae bacterium]
MRDRDAMEDAARREAADSVAPKSRGRQAAVWLLAAAAIWGVTYGLVNIAGSVERETLADSLEPVVQMDYLKLASIDPLNLKAADDSSSAEAAEPTGSTCAEITKASEAILKGDSAAADRRYSEAVNLYLRALELEPASEEARTQLWSTLDTWSTAEDATGPSEEAAGRLERAAEHAPRATWLLADYYLKRDRALGLLWLRRSAES